MYINVKTLKTLKTIQ